MALRKWYCKGSNEVIVRASSNSDTLSSVVRKPNTERDMIMSDTSEQGRRSEGSSPEATQLKHELTYRTTTVTAREVWKAIVYQRKLERDAYRTG